MKYNNDVFSLFQNTQKGTGTDYHTGGDNEPGDYFSLSRNYQWLEKLYLNSWICRRIVDFYPEAMGQAWGQVVVEKNPDVVEKTKNHFATLKNLYIQGQKVANLYGDSYVVRMVDDGLDISEPMDISKVTQVTYSRVFDYREIQPKIDMFEGSYYDPEHYHFYPSQAYKNHASLDSIIHKSRVIRFKGDFLPPQLFENNNYCYASVLEGVFLPLMRLDDGFAHVAEAVTSFEVILFALEGLLETLGSGSEEDRTNIKKRYKQIQQQISSMRGVVYDKDEEGITIAERKFTNIDQVLEQLRTELVAASGLTKVQLYNEHPTGLQATGESQRRVEAQKVEQKQISSWEPLINTDVEIKMIIEGGMDGYTWEWGSIYQESPVEKIERKDKLSTIDERYVRMTTFHPEEVRQRFTGTEYQEELVLEEKMTPQPDQTVPTVKEENTRIDQGNSPEDKYPNTDGEIFPLSAYAPIELENLQQLEETE